MVEYDKIYEDVKSMLSEKRFKHTEGVIERAIEYAEVYGVDLNKTKYAALCHDIAKELSKEESYEILKDTEELDSIEKNNINLMHSKVGAVLVRKKYGLPEDIVNAIKYHTTGKENMTMLEKVIYLADATEKNRVYKEEGNKLTLDELVSLIKNDIDVGLFYTLKWNLEDVIRKNRLIHIDSVKAYNFYFNA